jgi:Domain of unknown function (DUF4214)
VDEGALMERCSMKTIVAWALVFVVSLPSLAYSNLTIVGIACDELVVVNNSVIVCVHPLAETLAGLLKISDDSDFVIQSYRSLLWREPDPSGLEFWVGTLVSGAFTRSQLLDAFVSSAEFVALHRTGSL